MGTTIAQRSRTLRRERASSPASETLSLTLSELGQILDLLDSRIRCTIRSLTAHRQHHMRRPLRIMKHRLLRHLPLGLIGGIAVRVEVPEERERRARYLNPDPVSGQERLAGRRQIELQLPDPVALLGAAHRLDASSPEGIRIGVPDGVGGPIRVHIDQPQDELGLRCR